MNIQLDDAFQFGLGAFETIAVNHGNPILLDWHLERLSHTLRFLGIDQEVSEQYIFSCIRTEKEKDPSLFESPCAMKLMVSSRNILCTFRANPYTEEFLKKGFQLDYSPILRNETSPLVYHKTMNYGDNILEKRRTHDMDIDDVVFLNTKKQITEGSTNNIFFVKENHIYTPSVTCGLLPGILRRFVIESFDVCEQILYPEDIREMDECFVTNSLMGIMPVTRLGNKIFHSRDITGRCLNAYRNLL